MQTLEQLKNNVNREVSRDCYAETVDWMRKNGYAKKLRSQGIINKKGRLLV